jgi:hypothetical protein
MRLLRVVERMPEPAYRRRLRVEAAIEAALVVVMVATAALLVWVMSW